MSTPSLRAYAGSSACSASTNAARPPAFCASAIICRVIVVLPEDSGPKISMTRPRGTPPTPNAASNEMEPVEMTEIGTTSFDPSRMIEPLPNCFSSPERASSIALLRSSATLYLLCGGKNGGLDFHADSSTQNGKSKQKANTTNDVAGPPADLRLRF